ncbi:hypothetical protein SAMN05216548_10422 [Faunimonas pinastri]|uniref:Uncharacterized protein n=1 Tax=Faunimonas pinastri TaxID=1855383 RepID=A0A1H9F8F6_9HYPH|nr:hypothetical protein SAMN05216548_10422 [Faunimonas pinastri]
MSQAAPLDPFGSFPRVSLEDLLLSSFAEIALIFLSSLVTRENLPVDGFLTIAARSVSSMRVCQPGPVDRKWSSTSGERRSVVERLVSSERGLPRCRCISISSGATSRTGFIRASISSERGGESTASQSSCEICSGLRLLIERPFACICLPQADHPEVAASSAEDQHVETRPDVSESDLPHLAIVKSVVNHSPSRGKVEPLCLREFDAVFCDVRVVLGFVPDQHLNLCSYGNSVGQSEGVRKCRA